MHRKQLISIIAIAVVSGALGGIIFDRLVVPQLSAYRSFEWLAHYANNSPIVITKREQIVLNEGANLIELAKQAASSTISIYRESDLFFLGNGIILSSDGLIFTAKAAIGNLSTVLVVFNDGKTATGLVRALDSKSDLAALTIEAGRLAVLPFAESAKLQSGQKILSVGQLNKEFSRDFTSGSVTRGVADNKGLFEVLSSEILQDSFVTEAAFNPGFLGSPVMNLEGRLVGMVADGSGKIITAENIQTALSSYLANGKIVRPRLGIKYSQLSKMSAVLRGLPRAGALVVGVENNSPAANAGMIPSDIIYEIDQQALDEVSLEQILNRHAAGEMKVKLLRAGKEIEAIVTLELK